MSKQENGNKEEVTIGRKLANARIKKGYSIDDLQKMTKIQKKYLIAIEGNHFDQLPGDFYVRAFVKQYADSVGLDGRELLNDYDAKLPNTKSDDYVNKVSEDKLETRTAQNKSNDRFTAIKKYIPIASIVIVVVLIIVIIWVAAAKSSHNSSQVHISSNSSVSVSSSKESSASQSSSSSKSKAKAKNKRTNKSKKNSNDNGETKVTKENDTTFKVASSSKHNQLEISSGERNWVSVMANGSSVWQSAQQAGSSHTIKLPSDTKTATINLGNALKANIKVNGKKVDINSNNQVQQVTIKF
ncbi:XRE family transcriptional regulator [Philodulcilactobacillus myokoensis]|uniref:XRE family transcriptional regulator n=1 Tax=Philodulcilactobacillus myokoensis TaxID=2929573 RepID=A0A9W6B0C4_9LACO|nr:RodZ domain-containing protein [Philodulcilactobacillus myokoensis]GLB46669.1 XRE family transcriptional regulator [Philodulcilactobacillus myokoensis]